MAKFCTNCGKKLEEGVACDCKKVAAEKVQTSNAVTKNLQNIDAKDTAKTVIEIIKGIFVKPISTVKKLAEEKNINLGYVLLVVAALTQALFITVTINNYVEEVNDNPFSAVILMGSINEDGDEFEGIVGSLIEIDDDELVAKNVNIFAISTLTALALYAILAGAIFVIINKMMKIEVTWKKILVILSIVASIHIGLWILATVTSLIISGLTLYVMGIGSLYFIIVLYQSLCETLKLDKDKSALMYVAAYILVGIVVYILTQLFM